MIILGVDPALANCGWGIIEAQTNRITFIASGQIKTNTRMALEKRLASLYQQLLDVCHEHKPDAIAFEETFVNTNPASALKLGLARGALIAAAGHCVDSPINYYAPNAIKKAIAGFGHASKDQMVQMVQRLLPKAMISSHDEADALAIALCDALSRNWEKKVAG